MIRAEQPLSTAHRHDSGRADGASKLCVSSASGSQAKVAASMPARHRRTRQHCCATAKWACCRVVAASARGGVACKTGQGHGAVVQAESAASEDRRCRTTRHPYLLRRLCSSGSVKTSTSLSSRHTRWRFRKSSESTRLMSSREWTSCAQSNRSATVRYLQHTTQLRGGRRCAMVESHQRRIPCRPQEFQQIRS